MTNMYIDINIDTDIYFTTALTYHTETWLYNFSHRLFYDKTARKITKVKRHKTILERFNLHLPFIK